MLPTANDFFAPGRSEWDPETLWEQACDVQGILRRFEEANAAYVSRS
jgi:sugar (pentulose or hexulose) kinase